MKYVYILLALALIGGGYFFVASMQKETPVPAVVAPEGSHVMPDGTIMRNDAGTEGMGALDEFRQASLEEENAQDPVPAATSPDAKVFAIKGVNYGFDVKEIRVKKGDTVTIQFESTDGFHDWKIDEFNAATDRVQPGTPTSVTFVADESGTFEYYCSVGQHRHHGMVGTLIVE
jgi:plastocyanin